MLNFLPDALPDSKSTLSEQEEEEGRWALPDRAAAAVTKGGILFITLLCLLQQASNESCNQN